LDQTERGGEGGKEGGRENEKLENVRNENLHERILEAP